MTAGAGDPWAECRRVLAASVQDVGEQGEDLISGDREMATGTDMLAARFSYIHLGKMQKEYRFLQILLGFEFVPEGSIGFACGVSPDVIVASAPPADVVEVVGSPGAGKTQLALSVAAISAASGHSVTLFCVEDPPSLLAGRLAQILTCLQQGDNIIAGALSRLQIRAVSDFQQLAKAIDIEGQKAFEGDGDKCVRADVNNSGTPQSSRGDGGRAGSTQTFCLPRILIVDGLSALLAPFAYSQRWRIAWAWRALRRLASGNSRVLVLSHSAVRHHASSSTSTPRVALAHAAPTQFELCPEVGVDGRGRRLLRLSLMRCSRAIAAFSLVLAVDDAGVVSVCNDVSE